MRAPAAVPAVVHAVGAPQADEVAPAVPHARGQQAVRETVAAQRLDGAVLQEPGTGAGLDVRAGAPFDHDAADAGPGQQVGQNEARGPRADDGHLGAQPPHPGRLTRPARRPG